MRGDRRPIGSAGIPPGDRAEPSYIALRRQTPSGRAFCASFDLRGVKLAVSDAHEGLRAAAASVLRASRQCCRAEGPYLMNIVKRGTREHGHGLPVSVHRGGGGAAPDRACSNLARPGRAGTIRLKLLKIGALMSVSARRVTVWMASRPDQQHRLARSPAKLAAVGNPGQVGVRGTKYGVQRGTQYGGSRRPGAERSYPLPRHCVRGDRRSAVEPIPRRSQTKRTPRDGSGDVRRPSWGGA